MLPVGMKFFTESKLLSDPRKDRSVKPFPGKCKLCEKAGHEAFECEEAFTVDGRIALSYRELPAPQGPTAPFCLVCHPD